MTVKTKTLHRAAHTLGRRTFAKISAVEGIVLSREAEEALREFDRQGLSQSKRRKALLRKFTPKA